MEGNLHVDGHIEGVIHAGQDVSIGLAGVVEGTLVAQRVVVAGALRGKVECETILVVGRGCLMGEVLTDDLTVEPGATFVGESRLRERPVPVPEVVRPSAPRREDGAKLAKAHPEVLASDSPEGGGERKPGVARIHARGEQRENAPSPASQRVKP
jgi:cytoskeletal protein CcmA (bactofilin family)